MAIDSIVLAGPNQLQINLTDSILNSNEIWLSYTPGNVLSIYDKDLVAFNDTLVDNLLYGAPPRIIELSITENGDTLKAKYNMKMLLPSDISTLSLNAEYNGNMSIPILQTSFFKDDSTILAFPLGEQVYADYTLLLSYSGNNIASIDSGLLKSVSDIKVTNESTGLPVSIETGALDENAYVIALKFSKAMKMPDEQLNQLTFEVNGANAAIKEFFVFKNTIRFILPGNLYYGDTIKVSYNPGDIKAADRGALEAFSNLSVVNPLSIPTWVVIPEKIEAEDYTLQFGTRTETTSDAGGGLNVGWTDPGDWLVYAIENNTPETDLEISFRVAAQAAGSRFDFYLNDVKVGQVNVPSTGGWQSWRSVVRDISIDSGKQYFKIVVVTGGFNLNYFEIREKTTGISEQNTDDIKIYPNPASNYLVIKSPGFSYNKIEVVDITGKTVISKSISFEPELHLPVSLSNGVYAIKISNGNKLFTQMLIIHNK